MNSTIIAIGILKALAILIGIALLVWVITKIQSLILYCVLAIVLALLGSPLVDPLRSRLKFPNILAVIISILGIIGIVIGIVALFVPIITDQSENFTLFDTNAMQEKVNELFTKLSGELGAPKAVVKDIIEEADIENQVLNKLDVGFVPKLFNALLEILSSLGIGFFSVLFILFFF